jgi:cellulose synthase/poly-beta-1,6-N-acetylglucosamine synthase-like glycosyltransferase
LSLALLPGRFASFSEEVPLNWNNWVRQFHRWLSIAFTVTVIANFLALGLGEPPAWVVYSPLFSLFLLLFTGLYMFVLPYATTWRCGRPAGATE